MNAWIGLGRAAALLAFGLTGCAGVVDEGTTGAEVGEQAAELKNGTVFNGTGSSRGVVLLEIYWDTFGFWQKCSGQIVSKQSILTAAHCVYGVSTGNGGATWVRASRQTTAGWVDVIPSTWTTVRWNPAYDGSAKNDVGLVIAPTVQPLIGAVSADAALMSKSTPSGVNMNAYGFGYYSDTQFDGQGRWGSLTPTYDGAALDYRFSGTATSPWLCSGDSGGPLKSSYNGMLLQYGVASFHDGTGVCGSSGHWATTAQNIAWLKSKIAPSGSCLETATLLSCW